MDYNYTSRNQLYQDFLKKNQPGGLFSGSKNKKLFKAIYSSTWTYNQEDEIGKYADKMKNSGMQPSDYLRKYHNELVEFCVTKTYIEEYYGIVQKYNQFSYSRGIDRRTVRTQDYGPSMRDIFFILGSYYRLQFFDVSLEAYLKDELTEEKLDFKQNMNYYQGLNYLDDMIAAAVEAGNQRVIQAIKDIILGENNTAVISVPLIRGIIKSSDATMHKLLGDFLLAARLQEGVRQAVCENMDCGTEAAFRSLFQIIYENNLIRYSSVKRAVGTWIGLMNLNHTERIMGKILDTMHGCLFKESESERCVQSQDAIEIMVGLWCMGSHEIFDAVNVMHDFLNQGCRQQILVMSYYNREINFEKFSNEIAMKAIAGYPDDTEMIVAFYPTYLDNSRWVASSAIKTTREGNEEKVTIEPLHWNRYFESVTEAETHFDILKGVLSGMTGKKKTYAPFLFPWYSVELTRSEILADLCMIAHMLNDNAKKDYAVGLISQLDTGSRSIYLKLLLHKTETPIQRESLLHALSDREENTRSAAFQFLKKEQFQEEEYAKLMEMLRLKNHGIRQNILYLLQKRDDLGLEHTVKTLLEDKREEIRLAGLDLMMQLQKEESRKSVYEKVCPIILTIPNPTERETILIEQLSGMEEKECEEGFGLYLEKDQLHFPPVPFQKSDYPLFSVTTKQLKGLFAKLDSFIHNHREERVTNYLGEECILGNCRDGLPRLIPWEQQENLQVTTAFSSLWEEFYNTYLKDFPTLYTMYAAILPVGGGNIDEDITVWEEYNCELLGDSVAQMDISGYQYGTTWKKSPLNLFHDVLLSLVNLYKEEEYCREIGKKVCSFLTSKVQEPYSLLKKCQSQENIFYDIRGECYASQYVIKILANKFQDNWKNKEEWSERFYYLHEINRAYHLYHRKEENTCYYSYYRRDEMWLIPFDYMKAYQLGMITAEQMYWMLFEGNDLRSTLSCQRDVLNGIKYQNGKRELEKFGLVLQEKNFEQEFYDLVLHAADAITDAILNMELKRGDTPTKASRYIPYLSYVCGSERLIQILTALGKDKLVRGNYSNTKSKVGSLSCLLQISRPAPKETAKDLAEMLKGTTITKKRLVETGMFASEWLDLLEDVMEMPGFKSGAYYFMAHMDDFLDEKKTAMIAKYTPLSKEELRDGAFDIHWFWDVQEKLGEEQIALLYDAAKYISYGSKHTRARKYADAAMGRLKTQDVKGEIKEKRNKDLLMALGIIPFQGKEDLLDRYEYIRAFRKESKEFGSMRRASEEHAADMALKNMALAAGYRDVTRLILAMEGELTQNMQDCFEWKSVGADYQVKLESNKEGKVVLLCQKGDKTLKSVPAALKKSEVVISLKEIQKKRKEQYSRTVSMLENAMENREDYSLLELQKLLCNPVTGTIIQNLIFTGRNHTGGRCGFITKNGFADRENKILSVEEELVLFVAHPQDLYQSGEWTEFQKIFFRWKVEEKRTQPFRQVFRELYVKLEEEKKALSSKLFAGNQIQPARAAACLKRRGWVADYEEGLQKVYYRDNVVARIYALADWFSPSDIEAPTLEWVEFSNRLTFKEIPIGEVPDILYSEVMRDVDLAVSVAHAGSVDPETSHSTIEMRQVIAACNIELFGLTNVSVEGSYAMVTGKTGDYNIHLGSGVIHKIGSYQINVLPVHSQSRGKIFLPFMDEDPKTSEIISKILLFAQDDKIKDPYILRQL